MQKSCSSFLLQATDTTNVTIEHNNSLFCDFSQRNSDSIELSHDLRKFYCSAIDIDLWKFAIIMFPPGACLRHVEML